MKRLREKWNSQSGASILLALLFFLLCMMVAASVLMAAVSNAGKIRSNYEEQQKYLALSSALRLVAGQIEDAEYRGSYSVQRWTVPVLDEDGQPTGEVTKYYHVKQEEGDFTRGELGNALDFIKELDGLYAKEFTGTGYSTDIETASLPAAQELTVTVEGDEAVKEKFPAVVVKVGLRADLRVHLTAILYTKYEDDGTPKDEGSYRMEAELAASGLPVLDFTPGLDEFALDAPTGAYSSTPRAKPAEPDVTWKLDWIAKEVAGG